AATAPASSSWFCDGCTATTVLVIMRPFRPRHTGADQAAYTLTTTVPRAAATPRQPCDGAGSPAGQGSGCGVPNRIVSSAYEMTINWNPPASVISPVLAAAIGLPIALISPLWAGR
ncbi:hypothetical protein OSH49_24965, partial [Mycobacterium ulcerans]